MSLPVIILAWYSAVASVLVLGLAYLARVDRRTISNLYDRVDQQAEELAAWREEEDEEEDERFDASIQKLCAAEDERTAARIANALNRESVVFCDPATARATILRELQNAWKPDASEEVA